MSDFDRLTELEVKFAFLERHIAEQDSAMLDLVRQLERLTRKLDELRDRAEAEPAPGRDPAAERPPHY